jgi:uncharacterized protein YqgV (UPF0045/DUF77 family)
MMIELSITPLGYEAGWNDQLAEVLKLADALGLPYQLTPLGTRIEGGGDKIIGLLLQYHERLCQATPHVLTAATIEDEVGIQNSLPATIAPGRSRSSEQAEDPPAVLD